MSPVVHDRRPLVVSGPSGSGKSTLLKRLFAEFPSTFGFSISHTTRQPRAGESNGKDYHFVTRDQFEADVAAGKFVEHAIFGGNMYGTSIAAVQQVSQGNQPKICILDIDRQGVQSVKRTDMNARYVFIRPPSVEELEKRLRGRGTETEESFQKRMATVQDDLAFADQPGVYDLIVVNDNLEQAYVKLRQFILDHYDIEDNNNKQ